jgi:hypothetical protein
MTHKDLPIITEIKIPLRIQHVTDQENAVNNFGCGFANWKLQDNIAEVSQDDDTQVGHLGGSFGGMYEIDKYYPNRDNYQKWFKAQLNTEDIWYAVEKVLDKLATDPDEMVKLREKMEAYTAKKDKEAEIKKMQQEAEEEAELEKLIAAEEAEIAKLEKDLEDE